MRSRSVFEEMDRRGVQALESAVRHEARAAELRALGNEEHAADYDEMAERARARASEYGVV